MSGFTSLATAVSGLRAAQTGLAVTGHNMSNSEIPGYSRQRVLQKDYYYQTISIGRTGALKRGLGTDTGAIRQIRNEFLDLTYRAENGKLNFYAVKSVVGAEIEGLLGEMEGDYRFQEVINDVWRAIQELSAHPDGIETRDFFRATCEAFIVKANEVYDNLYEYQRNLDQQIRDTVTEINDLVSRIRELNLSISFNESSGDYANDYRDERNLCLDKLSAIIPIDYSEDSQKMITIFTDGHQLLTQTSQNFLGLKYCNGNSSLVEPVFTPSKTILPADTPPSKYESLFNFKAPFDAYHENDCGTLKGLIAARGSMSAYYNSVNMPDVPDPARLNNPAPLTQDELNAFIFHYGSYVDTATYDWDTDRAAIFAIIDPLYTTVQHNHQFNKWSAENALIPRTMIALDSIVNKIVTMINDMVAPYITGTGAKDPNAPYDLAGDQSYTEVFVRNLHKDGTWLQRFDPTTGIYNDVQPGDYYTQYSIGNISINPDLLKDGGYNLFAFSSNGDRGNNDVLIDMLNHWNSTTSPYAVTIGNLNFKIQDAYQKFVTTLATEFEESNKYVENQTVQVMLAENKRQSVMGVSLDEEMNNMMKYQYAYNAAARILNVIDGMLDKVINGMLR